MLTKRISHVKNDQNEDLKIKKLKIKTMIYKERFFYPVRCISLDSCGTDCI